MTTIGETLRRERMRRRLDLDQISRETKISPKLLQAIEAEDFGKLPGGVFAKSFVRQYARFLGLDEGELVSELDRVLEPAPVPGLDPKTGRADTPEIRLPRVEEWQGVSDSRFSFSSSLPALAMVVLVMLICSGVYAWWQRSRTHAPAPAEHPITAQSNRPSPVSAPPPAGAAQPQPVAPGGPSASSAPTGQEQMPQAAPPSETVPSATIPATAPPVSISGGQPAHTPESGTSAGSAAAPKPPDTATAPALAATGNEANPNAPVRVELIASEPSWVLVRVDGKYLFSGMLETNQTRSISGNETVLVRTGNAGGLGIRLNGKDLGVLGSKGQVKTVQLTSGGFHIVPAAPAAPKVPDLDPL